MKIVNVKEGECHSLESLEVTQLNLTLDLCYPVMQPSFLSDWDLLSSPVSAGNLALLELPNTSHWREMFTLWLSNTDWQHQPSTTLDGSAVLGCTLSHLTTTLHRDQRAQHQRSVPCDIFIYYIMSLLPFLKIISYKSDPDKIPKTARKNIFNSFTLLLILLLT